MLLSGQRSNVIRVNRRNVILARCRSSQSVHRRETARRLLSQYPRCGRHQAVRTTAVAAASRLHRRTRHRRRGHLQAAPTSSVHSTVNMAVSRPHAHVAAAVPGCEHRRDPLIYYTSTARSSSTRRRFRRTLPSAPRSSIARRTPSRDRRARHSATSSTAAGAPLQGAKGTPNIIPLRDRRSKKFATRGNRRA